MTLGFEAASNAATAVILGASAIAIVCVLILQRDVFKLVMTVPAGIVSLSLALGAATMLSTLATRQSWLAPDAPFVSILLVLNIGSVPFALAAIFGLVYMYGNSRLSEAFRRLARSHGRTLRRLKASRDDLQLRVAERSREAFELGKRLDIALRDSPITVALQDHELRYTWVRNAPTGIPASSFIGSTEVANLPQVEKARVMSLKRQVLETGNDARFEVHIPGGPGGASRYFDIIAEPYRNADGELVGLLSVSVETTDARHREEQIKDALMEISHRTKNQLAVLMALTRGLSASIADKDDFIDEFSSRLHAMSISQDVLVERRWQPARFDELLRAQLAPYLNRLKPLSDEPIKEIEISGPVLFIVPTAVQNVGLVLHEIIRAALVQTSPQTSATQMSWSIEIVDDAGTVVAAPPSNSMQTAKPGQSANTLPQRPKSAVRIRCRGLPPELCSATGQSNFAVATANRLSQYALEGSFAISTDKDGSTSAELLMPSKFAEYAATD